MTKEVLSAIQDAVGTQVFGIWFLIGAALVFFMQAGFAMVETGFTRAKNAGNIIMKNRLRGELGTPAQVQYRADHPHLYRGTVDGRSRCAGAAVHRGNQGNL